MARPLHIEEPGDRYPVAARDDEHRTVSRGHPDRFHFVRLLPRLREHCGSRGTPGATWICAFLLAQAFFCWPASQAAQAAAHRPLPPGAPSGPAAPAGHAWELIFQDEFDDTPRMSGPTNGLQPAKWNSGWFTHGIKATSQPVQKPEAEWYGPEGIVFPGDGSLHLRLFRNRSAAYNKEYESGMITTHSHFSFSPSRRRTVIEARIKVPGPNRHAKGYWPGFWLLPTINGPGTKPQWPPEIDIFEFFSNSTNPVAHLHTTGKDINKGFADSNGSTDLSLAFHTYTLDLSPSAFTFYLDGAKQWTYADAGNIANMLACDPMYVLLCFQFGGFAGPPTGAVPNDMVIDYVRAWQLFEATTNRFGADGRSAVR